MNKKKLYLVKREVYASSIKDAMVRPGKVYEIALADERFQPEVSKPAGFKPRKK